MKLQGKAKGIAAFLMKRWWLMLLVLNILSVLVFAGLYWKNSRNLLHYTYEETDFAQYVNTQDPRAVGNTFDEDNAFGLYNVVPSFFLRKGYYEYRVTWEGGSPGTFIWPHTYLDDRYHTVEQNVIYMAEGAAEDQNGFWINIDYSPSLVVCYSGQGEVKVTSFEIRETNMLAVRTLFLRIMGLLFLNVCVFVAVYQRRKGIPDSVRIAVIGCVMIALVSGIPALFSKTIEGHDLMFHLCRIEGIRDGWLSGQFPVRINPVFYNGYGYANPVFYGEFLLYLPAFLQLMGFHLTIAYNVYVVIINLITAGIAYYCFSKMLKNQWATLAVVFLYCMAPYRLVDIYLRSAVGEYSAIAFFPLVLYGMYRIYTTDTESGEYRYCFVPLVFGITGVLQSHVLSVEMIAVFLLMTCVFLLPMTFRKRRFFALVKTVIVSVLVNLGFLLPFFDYYRTGRFAVFNEKKVTYLQNGGVVFGQLFDLFPKWIWEFVGADSSIRSEMPNSLGLSLTLGVSLCIGLLLLSKKPEEKQSRKPVVLCLLLCLIAVWMSTVYFPWDVLIERLGDFAYLVCSIQFIWRFLAVASVLAALVCGYGLLILSERAGKASALCAAGVLCTLSLVSGVFFMEETLDNGKIHYMNDTRAVYTMGAVSGGEYSYSGSKWETAENVQEPEVSGGAKISGYKKIGTTAAFLVTEPGDNGTVLLPMIAFPGYRVTSKDGEISQEYLSEGDSARIRILIPEDFTGEIRVFYREPWYWRAAEILSLLTVGSMLVLWHRNRKLRW